MTLRVSRCCASNRPLSAALLGLIGLLFFSGCVQRVRDHSARTNDSQSPARQSTDQTSTQSNLININQATVNELETLPGIGQALAGRIIEHRGKYGPFRRPEHLIIVRGISDKRFRAIRELITVN